MQEKAEMEKKEEKVEKIQPSLLERGVDYLIVNTLGKIMPKSATPNRVTAFGAVGALIGIICAVMAKVHPLFLIGTCLGVLTHLVCDSLDGYVARTRNLKSNRGAYFDLLTDILHITYLLIALTFSGVMHWYFSIFMVPVYALIIFTSMNEILYLKRFSFPMVGPTETHFFFFALLIGSMITSCRVLFTIRGVDFTFADAVCVVGGIPMYIEMIRLQISIYIKIRREDKKAEE
jgi:phosphatidylglycerophosphate synthase